MSITNIQQMIALLNERSL